MSLHLRGQLQRPGPNAFKLAFDLSLPISGLTAICGPSGCGKTTLLRCVAGLEPHFRGTVSIGPRIWQDDTMTLPVHQRALGYVQQEGALFTHLSVADNLRFAWDRVPAARRRIDQTEVVKALDLSGLLPRQTALLSGGERQRVALARALLTCPDLLLLDEPLAALSTASRRVIFPLLENVIHNFGTPAIYVTHAIDEAARLADRMVILAGGQVIHQGPLAEVLTTAAPGLAHGRDAGAVVTAIVSAIDPAYHLATLAFPGGILLVNDRDLLAGTSVRLRIHARDISLTLRPTAETSILNILPATVLDILPDGPARALVRLRTGEVTLLAAITTRSVENLGLRSGQNVWAQIKSVALL